MKNVGLPVLGIYLVLAGVLRLLDVTHWAAVNLMSVLAIVAGALILWDVYRGRRQAGA